MGAIRNIAIFVLVVSFVTFVAFFGRLPAFRNTPIGALHRVIWVHIPNFLRRIDAVLTGNRLSSSLSRFGNYMLYEKHPIVIYFFLGLVTGSASLFIPPTWPYLSLPQKSLLFLLLPCPYIFTYLSQLSHTKSPHLINHTTNAQHMHHYPFDHILYHPNNICRTCELPKPARSKHCSLCGTCVARSDHHCIWVNNCVGMGNYKYFLSLLLTTSLLLFYGTYLAWTTLAPEVRSHFQTYPDWHRGSFDDATDLLGRFMGKFEKWTDALNTAFMVGGLARGGVGLLASLTALLPLGLLAYHIYLIWAGMTTNESGKWADWRDDMHDGLVFMADIKPEFVYGATNPISQHNTHSRNEQTNGTPSESTNHTHQAHRQDDYTWPVRSRQFLVRTNDGQSPRDVPPHIGHIIIDGSWRRCWHLRDVENIYDGGFWNNLVEVLRY
ncbi:zf-DHHC-domain-containing protein [Tothia fuscella]|uniref:Palmitoyltransferase n=1 Tax=Tothia fuscella TaxID=1048955 RepID=A0A9P4NDT1_9PEZI|nr:zf-DHHC-domain-containing protein [Tothia fuscella]